MNDDAVLRIGYDDSNVRKGAKGTEDTMKRSAEKIAHNWNHTSREIKDVFEPFSRGSLAKLGAVGVGVYAAKMAVREFREEVKFLAEADFVSPKTHAQMAELDSMLTSIGKKVSETGHQMFANASASLMDGLTGGEFSAAAESNERIKNANRLTEQHNELSRISRDIQFGFLTNEEKVGELKKREADMQIKIAELQRPKTGENHGERVAREQQVFDLQKQGLAVQAQRLGVEKSISAEKERQAKDLDAAALAYETQIMDNSVRGQMKVVQLGTKAGQLEREINETKNDDVKKLKLMADLEKTRADIVDEQNKLAEEGKGKAAKLNAARNSFGEDLQDKELRGAGHGRAADKLQRDRKLRDRAIEIAQDQGLDPQSALGLARREQKAEESMAKRAPRADGRHRIQGYNRQQYLDNPFVDHRTFNEVFHSAANRMHIPLSPSGARNRTSMTTRNGGESGDTKLLEQIAAGISTLASYH